MEKKGKRKPFTKKDVLFERWIRGRLNYKLHSGQLRIEEAVNQNQNQLFVGELARQFGKTFWLVKRALEKGFKKKKAKIKIGTAFQTDLVEFILPAFDAVMEDCPESIKPIWKSQSSKFVFPHNKSEIKLVGLDKKPNGLRGNVIDLIILDEAAFMSRLDYIYKSVIIPATTHRPDCEILVFSTPPDTPAHDFLDYVQKAELEGGYLKLTIYDNPMVDQKTIARLMKESGGEHSTTWRREYLCEHVTDAYLQIISGWSEKYVEAVPRDAFYNFYHKYVNMDLGVKDHTAATFGYYDFRRAAYIIEDEFIINGPMMNTQILQAHLKAREMNLWAEGVNIEFKDPLMLTQDEISHVNTLYAYHQPKVYLRVSDNNNPLLLQDLSHLHQLHFMATDKGKLVEMVNATKILVSQSALIVHPHCKQVIGCLKYGVWDKHRKAFDHSKVFGHFDALAAVIYGVRNLDQITNPIPPGYMLDPDNQLLFVKERLSPTAHGLKLGFQKSG